MYETRSDDMFLPSYQDEALVDNLLSCEKSDKDFGGEGFSLAQALLPLVDSSSTLNPMVCSTRYKTELCTSYSASGFCKYAERCQFAHGLHELHVPCRHPKYKTELCRGFHTTGSCYYGNRCLFVHKSAEQRPTVRRHRNIPCHTFRTFGVCPFGTRCNFLHVEADVSGDVGGNVSGDVGGGNVSSDAESPAASEKPPAPVSSALSRPQAKEWKPRGALCRTFSSFGFCLYGTRCRFQHSLPSKIRPADQFQEGSLYPQAYLGSAGLPSRRSSGLPYPGSSGLPSPTSLFTSSPPLSSTSFSPPASPLATPPEEAVAHNAFTFSSQHLSDLLLPLAIRLQQLECSKGQEIWDNRAL